MEENKGEKYLLFFVYGSGGKYPGGDGWRKHPG